ncbi:cytochrome c [Simiduia aestuariiviva]|uniref:Cytochrome c n=1 Tax=Simiduia aestuariiviva TaxID=1510459 RepID=A0A839UVW1_9GAMM|nr:cytochrome c [Simiduia aestuariiviva]MBB3169598.1 hypothetical protein [Simiduia aestuariiviva]
MKLTQTLFPFLRTLSAIGLASFMAVDARAGSAVEQLNPATRALLGQEMRALEQGMHQLVSAYVAGDMVRVAQTAGQMKDGYIMRQQLTAAQRQELTTSLPDEFKLRDQDFHRYAAMLQHVAEEKHTDLVSYYYLKMMDACIGCHDRYARSRFPALIEDGHKDSQHQRSEGHHH